MAGWLNKYQDRSKVAMTPAEQYQGLNAPEYDSMFFPTVGPSVYRGLDNYAPVHVKDILGKEKILRGPDDHSVFFGPVQEKLMRNGGWLQKYQNGGIGFTNQQTTPASGDVQVSSSPVADAERVARYQQLHANDRNEVMRPTPKPIQRTPQQQRDWEENIRNKGYDPGTGEPMPLTRATNYLNKTGVGNLVDRFGDAANVIGAVEGVAESIPKILSNAYKVNPFAFKPGPGGFYRMLGEDGVKDAFESGSIRANPEGLFKDKPYFSRGKVLDKEYTGPNMVEVAGHPMQQNDMAYYSPHGEVYIPKDPIPTNHPYATFYKQDWLQGYKEIPKPKTFIESNVAPHDPYSSIEKKANNYSPYNPSTLNTPNKWLDGYKDGLGKMEPGTNNSNIVETPFSKPIDIDIQNKKTYDLGKGFITDDKGQRVPFNHATGQSMQQDYINNIKQYFDGPAFKEKMAIQHPEVDPEEYKKAVLHNLTRSDLVEGSTPGNGGYYVPRNSVPNNTFIMPGSEGPSFKRKIQLANEEIVNPSYTEGIDGYNSQRGRAFSATADEAVDHELGHQRTNGDWLLPDEITKKFLTQNLSPEGYQLAEQEVRDGVDHGFYNYYSNPTEFDTRLMNFRKHLKREGIVDYTQTNDITPEHIKQIYNDIPVKEEWHGADYETAAMLKDQYKANEITKEQYDKWLNKALTPANRVRQYTKPGNMTRDTKALLKYHDPEFLSQMMKYLPVVAPVGIGAAALSQQDNKKYGGWLTKYK